jgi:pyridinium-3,5-bisthiocarboxylic acid mononucleotide nickel chelatase
MHEPSGLMRIAYFDCFAGISGSMALGALLHAGADLEAISDAIDTLPTAGYVLEREDVDIAGVPSTRVHIRERPDGVIHTYASIRSMLEAVDIPGDARRTALKAFRLLAEAEARLQNRETEVVTFYDSGEHDVLVPILGTALALQQLEVDRVFASAVPTGLGMTRSEHGMLPIPSPLVMALLTGVPTYSRGIPAELVTPVGAAILVAVAEGYGEIPLMRPDRVGYGAGELRLDFPNVLRVLIGESAGPGPLGPPAEELVFQVKMTGLGPQAVPALLRDLIETGAADAWLTPIVGADGEPAVMVSAVVGPAARAPVRRMLQRRAGQAEVRSVPLRSAT